MRGRLLPFVTALALTVLRTLAIACTATLSVTAQDPPFPGGPGGFPGGQGGPGGGPRSEDLKVLERFDADQSGRLDAAERKAAREWLASNRPQGRGMRGGPGGPGGPGGMGGPGGPGGREGGGRFLADAKGDTVAVDQAATYAERDVWDPDVVRTIFITFDHDDWYDELTAFYRTDVQVGATVRIDGVTLPNVGTAFRGNTSFQMVRGKKKSWDLQFDWTDEKQSWRGIRNLDLINGNGDASFVREMLHGWVATQFFPAARVALVRLVVNGEDFGIYAAVQQFDKDFLKDHFDTPKGDRWKVPPDFSGNGGLRYLGDEPEAYKRSYQIKSKEDPRAWQALVDLCGALEFASTEDLPRILPQHLDVEGALWFLAIDHVLADDDGYYSRASDYNLYRDPRGKFHLVPRDNNEILLARGARGPGGPGAVPGTSSEPPPGGPGGPGGRRGPGGPGGGTATTPLQGATRADRPLLRRLLEVPAWRERYLSNIRGILDTALADATVAERLNKWHDAIAPFVARDQHSPYDAQAFERCFAVDQDGKPAPGSLRAVIEQRRAAILGSPEMRAGGK